MVDLTTSWWTSRRHGGPCLAVTGLPASHRSPEATERPPPAVLPRRGLRRPRLHPLLPGGGLLPTGGRRLVAARR